MKIQALIAYVIVALGSVILTKAADDAPGVPLGGGHSPIQFDFDAIAKMSSPELQKALADIADNEQAMEREINSKLSDNNNPRQVTIAAIFIAGQYRLQSCNTNLARMLNFSGNYHSGVLISPSELPLDEYPVRRATDRLGDAMLLPLLEEIATSDDAHTREICVNYIRAYQKSSSVNATIQPEIEAQTQSGNKAGAARLKALAPQLINPAAN
ncbi:MAG: hypothetical protein ABSH22_21300 [Tepidisphaeraceae bacterium]|jgi:hypothetical protein